MSRHVPCADLTVGRKFISCNDLHACARAPVCFREVLHFSLHFCPAVKSVLNHLKWFLMACCLVCDKHLLCFTPSQACQTNVQPFFFLSGGCGKILLVLISSKLPETHRVGQTGRLSLPAGRMEIVSEFLLEDVLQLICSPQ